MVDEGQTPLLTINVFRETSNTVLLKTNWLQYHMENNAAARRRRAVHVCYGRLYVAARRNQVAAAALTDDGEHSSQVCRLQCWPRPYHHCWRAAQQQPQPWRRTKTLEVSERSGWAITVTASVIDGRTVTVWKHRRYQ